MSSSCPDCENIYTDAQIESKEVVPCDDDTETEDEGANDSDFTDCEDCGYTHLCEDKCPNDATKCHYEKWREEEEDDTETDDEEEDDWECQKCHATFPIEDDHKVKQHKHRGTLCLRCYEYITRDDESEEADD
jgi:hypothetical protein